VGRTVRKWALSALGGNRNHDQRFAFMASAAAMGAIGGPEFRVRVNHPLEWRRKGAENFESSQKFGILRSDAASDRAHHRSVAVHIGLLR